MDEMTLHRKRRLRALIDGPQFKGSQLALANAVKLSEGRVSQLLDPELSFGERSAKKIATELRLEERYFDAGFVSDEETLMVPRLDVVVAAGDGAVSSSEDVIGGLTFRRDFLRECDIHDANEAVIVNVKGESMGNMNGAVLLVNKKIRTPVKDKVFVFVRGEGPSVKRVIKRGGAWIATSDNEDKSRYPDFPFEDGHTLIGRAVWMGVKL
ncbi:S24 family peptidase [Variovorax sp.]|jgi:phage repressor protein C with HTH and peptisase S24 domain|uniref:S24 family peptidase n=1 Tax=Variovorax sp. TaxID=1871043 RepID=UPI004037BEE3